LLSLAVPVDAAGDLAGFPRPFLFAVHALVLCRHFGTSHSLSVANCFPRIARGLSPVGGGGASSDSPRTPLEETGRGSGSPETSFSEVDPSPSRNSSAVKVENL